MIQFDSWQKDFIQEKSHKILVSGRQTGKSEAQAYDNALYAINNPNTTALIISKTERQAEELLFKTLNYLQELAPKQVMTRGRDKLTKHRVGLKNGARVLCLPTGVAGEGIRFLTIHKLTVDEAQLINDEIYTAVTPMLLTTGGKISLSGTPQGKQGFFWKAYENKLNHYKVFHVNSEQVIKDREISEVWTEQRREGAIRHLDEEKNRMSAKEYAQEYLGQFIEDLRQFFSDEIIRKTCILKRNMLPRSMGYNVMGCDLARLGGDESTFEILNISQNSPIRQVENIIKKGLLTTQNEEVIVNLNDSWNLSKIGIDAGAGTLGVSIYDHLLNDVRTKRKVIAMNNRSVALDRDGKKRQRIFKEDMYDNLLSMMEKEQIDLLDDDELRASLKSVQWEIITKSNIPSKVRIFGNYTHIAEGLVRAAWLANKEKSLNINITYI